MDLSYVHTERLEDIGPVEVLFEPEDLVGPMRMAELKVDMINVHSPRGHARPRDVRLRRLVAGKLADHAVRYLLARFMRRRATDWRVEEYDEIRTDNFRDSDPWDLRCVGPGNRSILLEVRSSFVHWLSDAHALHRHPSQSLLGPYATGSKPGERMKDLFWQVAFFRVPSDEPSRAKNRPFFGDERDLPLSATIMGGGELQLFDRIGFDERRMAEGANYRVIQPMSDGRSVGEMLRLSVTPEPISS
ncbi:hypothetical protein SAMN05428984_4297 [Sphingomonas sp. OK281]|nr:hypothetical protein SAMN05428984_4297 [Sphingomonas sp. OK281]